ncbi:hypothetical protein BDR26DRAFT_945353 [Obelidium mucronatum]|nr:hypothetical protein BDR26DRAFT_945353 [Obelidium mucronatum]
MNQLKSPETRPPITWQQLEDPETLRSGLEGHQQLFGIPGAAPAGPFFVIQTSFALPNDWSPHICETFKQTLDKKLTKWTRIQRKPVNCHNTRLDWIVRIDQDEYMVEIFMWPAVNNWGVQAVMKIGTDGIYSSFDAVAQIHPPFPTILDYSNIEDLLSRLECHGVCHALHPLAINETELVTKVLEAMAESVFWPVNATHSRLDWLQMYHLAGKKFFSGLRHNLPAGVERISGNAFQYNLNTWSDIMDWATINSEELNLGPGASSTLQSALKKMEQSRTTAYSQIMTRFFGEKVLESEIKSTGISLLMSVPKLTFQQLDHFDAQVMGVYSTLFSIGETTNTTLFHKTSNFLEKYSPRSRLLGERNSAVCQSGSGVPLIEADEVYVHANYSSLLQEEPPQRWSARGFIPGSEVSFLGLVGHCGKGNDAEPPRIPDCYCEESVRPTYQDSSSLGILHCRCQLFGKSKKAVVAELPSSEEGIKPVYKLFDQLCADPFNRRITSEGQIRSSTAASYLKGFRHSYHFVRLARDLLYDGQAGMLGHLGSTDDITKRLMCFVRAGKLVDLFSPDSYAVVAENFADIVAMSMEEWEQLNTGTIGASIAIHVGAYDKEHLSNEDDDMEFNQDDELDDPDYTPENDSVTEQLTADESFDAGYFQEDVLDEAEYSGENDLAETGSTTNAPVNALDNLDKGILHLEYSGDSSNSTVQVRNVL